MVQERLSMRKILEILRLKHELELSNRKIAQSCNVGRNTVSNYLSRAKKAGLSWPLPRDMSEEQLYQLLPRIRLAQN